MVKPVLFYGSLKLVQISWHPYYLPDGTVYVTSYDKRIYAIEAATGNLRWGFETQGYIDSAPGVGRNGYVYFGSGDKGIRTGRKYW